MSTNANLRNHPVLMKCSNVHSSIYEVPLQFLSEDDQGLTDFSILYVKVDGGMGFVEDNFFGSENQSGHWFPFDAAAGVSEEGAESVPHC